eukprot:1183238-Prorocentrum_minimum.AAC.2
MYASPRADAQAAPPRRQAGRGGGQAGGVLRPSWRRRNLRRLRGGLVLRAGVRDSCVHDDLPSGQHPVGFRTQ